MKLSRLFACLLVALWLFGCKGKFDDYRSIPMVYDASLMDSLSVFVAENLYFEPMYGFVRLPMDILSEFTNLVQQRRALYEVPIIAFADSMSQMIVISEVRSDRFSPQEAFMNSFEHYSTIYADNLTDSARFRLENYLINRFIIASYDFIVTKVVLGYLEAGEITNVYMIDFVLARENHVARMQGVESSIMSLVKFNFMDSERK